SLFGYHNMIKGIGLFIGGLSAGLIAEYYSVQTALFFAGIIPLLIMFVYFHKIKDIKIVTHKPSFFRTVIGLPMMGLRYDMIVGMNRTTSVFREHLRKIEMKLDIW